VNVSDYKYRSPFRLDDRVKPDLLQFARQIVAGTQLLHESIAEKKKRGDAAIDCTELVNLHFTVLASSVTDSALILIAHGNGRDAQILERAQYEYFLNAAFYGYRHDKAALYYLARPAHALREYGNIGVKSGPVIDALRFELRQNEAQLDSALAPRLATYRQPSVEFMENALLLDPKKSRALKYARPSLIAHARSISTRQTIPLVDNKLMIKFNPVTEYPNQEILEFAFLMMQILRIAGDVHQLTTEGMVNEFAGGLLRWKAMLEQENPAAYADGTLFDLASHETMSDE
jgi:hypothetical protein